MYNTNYYNSKTFDVYCRIKQVRNYININRNQDFFMKGKKKLNIKYKIKRQENRFF